MRKCLILSMLLFLLPIAGNAQVPFGERVPDIRYPVSGQRKLSRLSNDDVLYTILYFGYNNEPVDGQSGLDANPEYFALTLSDLLKPYFNNFNPDYGRALMMVSKMKGQAWIERKLGVTSYPDIVLVDSNNRIIARSSKATDIIDYIINNLSMFAVTDWNAYISSEHRNCMKPGRSKAPRESCQTVCGTADGMKTSLRKRTKPFRRLSLQ